MILSMVIEVARKNNCTNCTRLSSMMMPLDPETFFISSIAGRTLPAYDRFLLAHGRTIDYDVISPQTPDTGVSFGAALQVAKSGGGIYCEGLAVRVGSVYPTVHAWCLSGFDDIEDPAWGHNGLEFYGMQFNLDCISPHSTIISKIGVLGLVSSMRLSDQEAFLSKAVLPFSNAF